MVARLGLDEEYVKPIFSMAEEGNSTVVIAVSHGSVFLWVADTQSYADGGYIVDSDISNAVLMPTLPLRFWL